MPRPLKRRAFIVGGAAALTAAACASGSSDSSGSDGGSTTTHAGGATTRPRPDAGARRRVVVVGAGLAGLTVALDLRAAGWDVVVLEARDRVGGRVHTVREPFDHGLHAEAGGESVDDDHLALLAMAKRFAIPLERRPADKLLTGTVLQGGRRRTIAGLVGEQGGKVATDYTRAYDELARLAAAEAIDPEKPEAAAHAEQLDQRTLASFVDGLGLIPTARFLVDTANRGEYNAESRDLSLLFVLQQTAVVADVPDSASEALRLTGGNDRLATAMAAELGAIVRLSSPVDQIEHGPDGVRVRSGSVTLDAARLVLATPPHGLQDVDFRPALTGAAAEIVTDLQLGAAVKTISQFDQRFWTKDGGSGFTLTDLPFHIGWSPTDSYGAATDPGLLTTFTTGDAGRDFAALTDAERIRTAQAQLLAVYPEGEELLAERAATVSWPFERFTGGGYSVFRPGQMTRFWPVLRAPLGPIHFAGEHTESLSGFMESAIRSGHRIAAAIGLPPS